MIRIEPDRHRHHGFRRRFCDQRYLGFRLGTEYRIDGFCAGDCFVVQLYVQSVFAHERDCGRTGGCLLAALAMGLVDFSAARHSAVHVACAV